MESFIIFVTVLVLVQKAIAAATPACTRQYEVYNTCGTACPLTCDNYKTPPRMCTANCVLGCQCGGGYIRNTADGNCYKPSECPGTKTNCLFSHEVYNDCGTACPLTCDNYKDPPAFCTDQCVQECQCESGYVRNTADGTCCTPSECPDTKTNCLLSHEVYNDCGTACPLTCDNYKDPPTFCTEQCVQECQCGSGYVRNTADGNCCKPSECPI